MFRSEIVNFMFWSSFGFHWSSFQDSAGLTFFPASLPVCTRTRLYPISCSKGSLTGCFVLFCGFCLVFFLQAFFFSWCKNACHKSNFPRKLLTQFFFTCFACLLIFFLFFLPFSYCCNINFHLCSIKTKTKKCHFLRLWSFWVACDAKIKTLPSP